MTAFKKYDRVRVLAGAAYLTEGAIETIFASSGGPHALMGHGEAVWSSDCFEFVERAVNTDKDGKPLYVGDIARRIDVPDGLIPREGPVDATQPIHGAKVGIQARNAYGSADLTPPRELVVLVRHHWEIEPEEPSVASLFADAVTAAVQAVQAATRPGLPTAPGSIVSPAAGPNPGAEAVLIGGRWLYSNDGGQAEPAGWIGGWRIVRDAGKENA